MPVHKHMDVNAASLRLDQRVDDAILILAAQFVDKEQAGLDRSLRLVNGGNDGLMGPVILSVSQRLTAKSIQKVEAAKRIDYIGLNDATANALKDVVEQAAHSP